MPAHEQMLRTLERTRKEGFGPVNEGLGEAFGDKVAEDTYVLDDEFVMVVAWNSSCIGEGFMVTPCAKVTETGVFDIIMVRAGISRMEMLSVLLSCEDGSFINKTDRYLYFKARRLEFETIEGKYLTVDGEPVPVEPFVLEMAPEDGLIRILDSFSEP